MIRCYIYLHERSNPEDVKGPLSTKDKIKVGRWGDDYAISYLVQEWTGLDPVSFASTAVDMFKRNLPGKTYEFIIVYFRKNQHEAPNIEFANSIVVEFKMLESASVHVEALDSLEGKHPIKLEPKAEPKEEIDREWYEDFDEYEDEEDSEEDDLDYPYTSDLREKKPSKKQYYGQSRVWKDSNHVKRSINRHGVVVTSKSNRKRDLKLIKEFLKDFIPGNQGWKKEFRSELAKRWMNVYSVSKGQLKELEKSVRNKKTSSKNKKTINSALGIAGTILKSAKDQDWFNPNK